MAIEQGAQWALLEILAINLRLLTLTGSCLLTFWPRLLGREAKGVIVGAMPSIRPTTASHWPRGPAPKGRGSVFFRSQRSSNSRLQEKENWRKESQTQRMRFLAILFLSC
ncbi:hypothetical protein CEXT_683991 [Caerostris extrusa]|uniref:Uncharacterized protein n=1 Tax=Caerostris extrusa TaxID=172846 RepID=A0AAV4VLW0_CAEEX|nr:hypothetical protein CEXT_683991 [Caerostris extrusa]